MEAKEEFVFTEDTVVADIKNEIGGVKNGALQYKQIVEIKVPMEDINDYKIAVRKSSIKKITNACKEIENNKFAWGELLLGISTLFFGAFFSAIISGVKYELKLLSVMFYTIFPTIAVATLIGYIACRKSLIRDAGYLANIVNEHLVLEEEMEEKE